MINLPPVAKKHFFESVKKLPSLANSADTPTEQSTERVPPSTSRLAFTRPTVLSRANRSLGVLPFWSRLTCESLTTKEWCTRRNRFHSSRSSLRSSTLALQKSYRIVAPGDLQSFFWNRQSERNRWPGKMGRVGAGTNWLGSGGGVFEQLSLVVVASCERGTEVPPRPGCWHRRVCCVC